MDNFIVKGYSQELEIKNVVKEHYFTRIFFISKSDRKFNDTKGPLGPNFFLMTISRGGWM